MKSSQVRVYLAGFRGYVKVATELVDLGYKIAVQVEESDVVLRLDFTQTSHDECDRADEAGIPVALNICDLPDPAGVTGDERVVMTPAATQVGGTHYTDMAIQPVNYIHRNGLGYCEGAVIKYVSRHRVEGGREDLEKARHFIDLLIALEYGAPEGGAA